MSLFHSLLRNIQKTFEKENEYKEQIILIIKEVVGVTLTEDMIVVRNGVLTLKASGTVKMAVLMKKDLLLHTFKTTSSTIYSIR